MTRGNVPQGLGSHSFDLEPAHADTTDPGSPPNTNMGFEDKRRSQRYDVQLALRVTRGEDTVVGMTRNVSLGGLMAEVPLDPAPSLGERLQLSFSIPQLDGPIEVEAEVRWMGASGLGLQFMTGLRAKQTWALGRFLESLAS